MNIISKRWTMNWLARLLACLAIVIGTPATAIAGTTYYIDTNGSDNNPGTSPGAAWQTLAKVNATTFQPGDSILFHTGESWSGQLAPAGSGSAADGPITISSYGGGDRPKIDAGGVAGANMSCAASALLFTSQQYWTIDGLEITNDAAGNNPDKGKVRAGICINNKTSGTMKDITITNNYIHDVDGCFTCNSYDGHYNGGIIITRPSTVGGTYDDVYIANNTIQNVDRVGIVVGYPSSSYQSTRVTIRGNKVVDAAGDGIIVSGAEGTLIEGNTVSGAGLLTESNAGNPESAGIWWSYTDHTTVQFNEVSGVVNHVIGGQGYDIDSHASTTKIQYNYSHDNQGGFLLLMGLGLGGLPSPSQYAIVRYNLSVNDAFPGVPGNGVITFSDGVTDQIEIQNNTFYVPPGSPAWIMGCSDSPTSHTCSTKVYPDWRFRNNLVYNLGSGDYDYLNRSGAVFQTNLYFGNHPPGEPAESGKLSFDPQLAAPGGTTPAGYQLLPGSPAIGAGTLQPQNGSLDYFGDMLSATTAPSVGFHEGGVFAGPPLLLDGADDFLALARASSNVTLDTTTPADFNGDASRFTRSGSSPGNITWLFEGMSNFSAVVYLRQADPTAVTFWSSPDGRSFTQVATVNTTPQATAGSWSTTTYTPAAPLPAGTAFLMASIDPPPPYLSSSPKAELGQIGITR